MGNICSRSSNKPDSFATPGRVLGSTPAPQEGRASAPASKIRGPGRAVGGASGALPDDDPRAAAARAAEERASKAAQPKGKLGEQLAAQKRQTRTDTLEQASKDERAAREADDIAQARQWN